MKQRWNNSFSDQPALTKTPRNTILSRSHFIY